jgi:phospholipid transport system substrate-binding protein
MTRASRLLLISALLALAVALPCAAETEPATAVVESLHATFVDVMKDAESLGYVGRFEKLQPAIVGAYDMTFMSEKVLGRHWKTLTDDEKARWKELFSRMMVSNYASRFESYSGENWVTLGQQPAARDTQLVQTKLIVSDSETIEFNYRLHETEQGWEILDLYMNGTVSELALRRSDYSSMLKRSGFDKLAASVGEKIAKFERRGSDTLAAKASE